MKTLDMKLKEFLCDKFNPLNFVYKNFYNYYINRAYKQLNNMGLREGTMLDYQYNIIHRTAIQKALKHARVYEKFFYNPILSKYCDNDN